MRKLTASLLLAASISCLPSASWAWGANGHAMVADIAMDILSDPKTGSPSTVAKLQALLPYAHKVDSGTLPVSTIADIASAPDSWRAGAHPETTQWHFVDVPLHSDAYDEGRDCHYTDDGQSTGPGLTCIVAKLPEFVAILADKSKSDEERGFALAFVVHLVGDIHQPLHAEDDKDKGGNDVKFTWRGGAAPTNLHTIWDSTLIDEHFGLPVAHRDPDPNKNYKIDLGPAHEAEKKLDPAACPDKPASWVKAGVTHDMNAAAREWANQSHQLALALYANLPAGFPAGWEDTYARYARPVIACQIERGGVRLAQVLREALP
jgi:hypothetical protein